MRELLFKAVLTAVLLTGVPLAAQTNSQLASATGARGIVPTGNYSISNIESIDNIYGTVSYNIPLANLPPGRAGMAVGLPLIYNSALWDMTFGLNTNYDANGVPSANLALSQNGGWQYGYQYGLSIQFSPSFYSNSAPPTGFTVPPCGNNAVNFEFYQLSAVFPDGSQHVLRLYSATDDSQSGFYAELPGLSTFACPSTRTAGDYTYYTTDGTYVKLVISQSGSDAACAGYQWNGNFHGCWATHSWTMYLPDGRQVSSPGGPQANAILDRNGNKVTFTNIEDIAITQGSGAGTLLQDDLGRSIQVVRVLGTNQSTKDVITQTGENNSLLTWVVQWQLATLTGPVTYNGCTYQAQQNDSTCKPPSPLLTIQSIAFPADANGFVPTYQFGYDTTGWGQLNSVTTPSGASVAYTYASNAGNCNGAQCATSVQMSPPRNPVATKTVTYCDEFDQTTPSTSPCMAPTPTPYNTYTWGYNFLGTTESIVQGPDGGLTTTMFNDFSPADWSGTFNGGVTPWYAGLVYFVQHPDGSTTEQLWQQNLPYARTNPASVTVAGTSANPGNPTVAATLECLPGTGGSCVQNTNAQFTASSFYYDRNGNAILQYNYDWKPYTTSNVPHAIVNGQQGPTASYVPGNLLKSTASSFATQASSATPAGAGVDDANAYWNPATNPSSGGNWPLATKLPVCVVVTGSGNGSVSQYQYDSGGTITKGNLTQEVEWNSSAVNAGSQPACSTVLTSSNAVVQSWVYDGYGNTTQTTDANSHSTSVTYSNNLYPSTRTDPLSRVTSFNFDFNTGLLSSQTDYNGLTQTHTRDNLGREIQLLETGSSGLLRETTTTYEDVNRRVITKTDNATPGDQQLVSVTDYDQLGRVRLTRQLESSSQNVDSDSDGIKVQTRYGFGNPLSFRIVSNPYRASTSANASGEATMGWTVSSSDWSHRVSASTFYSGAGSPTPAAVTGCGGTGSQVSCSSGNTTVSTDEAGVTRTSTVDGLGRVVTVVENGICNATTSHGYDVLGNLTSVIHAGYGMTCPTLPAAQIENRTFVYDSLSRLVSATNPESGTTSYTYDGNGNVLTKTDGRGIGASMTYDALNRLTGKSYSCCVITAPSVAYSYVPGKDFLSSVTSSAASYSYSNFDAYGRPGAGTQAVGSQSWTFPSVVWTPQGQVALLTYPSGRVVTTSFDLAGRIAGVAGSLSGTGTSYVSTPSVASQAYAAQGGILQWTGGDQITRSMGYNARLQTTSVGTSNNLLTVGLNWAANGNLTSQKVTRPSLNVSTQSYGYDGVNRLSTAVETNSSGQLWNQSYVYDNVGNRGVMGSVVNSNYTPAATSSTSIPFNNANQWTGVDNPAGYDAAGNTTRVRTQTMVYDAESRMTSWADSAVSGSGVTLTYDGDGRRITKTSNLLGTTTYVYDPAGNLAVEVGGSSATGASTAYLTADHLGSVRLVTNASGTCLGAHDYLPFGEEIPGNWGRGAVPCYAQTDTTWKFGGQERDAENGLDYFGARYFGSGMGRFTSPDPLGNFVADLRNPQSWNLYSYVWNNPLTNVDPTGTTCVSVSHPDGSTGQADNGDGQGCKAAEVSPTKDGKPPTDTNDIAPQQATFSYFDPRFNTHGDPNDKTQLQQQQELGRKVFQNTGVIAHPLCSAGVFRFRGTGAEIGNPAFNIHGGVYSVVDYNSETGISVGVLGEAGATAYGVSVSGGKELTRNLRTGRTDTAAVGFVGLGPVSGLASKGNDPNPEIGLVVGDHAGVGAYVVPSINGCSGR